MGRTRLLRQGKGSGRPGTRERRAPKLRALILTVAVVPAAAACGGVAASSASGPAHTSVQTNLTVATLPVVDNTPIWLGVKKGIFAKYGLHVTYENLSGGGPANVSALQSGSVQFANLSSPVFMLATAKGIAIKSILELDKIGRTVSPEGIFVLGSSPIKTLAQLKGATIGVNATTSLEEVRMLSEVLPALHLTTSDVKFVPIPWPQEKEALLTHEVDAVVPFDPYTTELSQTPGVRELSGLRRFAPASGLSLGVFATSSSYASSHPAVVTAFQKAVGAAIDYTTAHTTEAAAVAASVLSLAPSLAKTTLGHVQFIPNGTQNTTSYDNMQSALVTAGLVPSSYSISNFLVK